MTKKRITVARAMVEALQAEGIRHIFGYPGAAICPFFDELIDSGIENILVRHEVNCGHSASGYARITGKPAVCVATSGPGATNLITAIATAHMDSIPLIAITGQVVSSQIGRDAFQEADITGACEPFVKHSYLVKNAADIGEVMKKSFYIAGSGRPGPVLIDVPIDIQQTEIDFEYPETVELRSYKPSSTGNKLQVKKAAAALEKSKRPLICAGGGIFIAEANLLMKQLCETCGIPVISTMMGIGSIPTTHPSYLGMLGMHGRKRANWALTNCDLLIILGARVGDRSIKTLRSFENTTVIHIDIDPAEIGKNVPVNIPVVGDVKLILQQFLDLAKPMTHAEWFSELRSFEDAGSPAITPTPSGCVSPIKFMEQLNKALPERSVVCADVGQNQIWTANNVTVSDKGRFITSGGMGTMGYALPAAIGAKKADESAEVVAICGDGSFQMSFMELATALQHDINVKIVVYVNNYLGMVREYQDNNTDGRRTAVELNGSPDFLLLAKSYGIAAGNVTDNSQIEQAVAEMVNSPKSYLLQVFVSGEEKSLLYSEVGE